MKRLRSLRKTINELRALGEIQEIDVEVDWNLEMGAIIRRSYELQAPAPLFNKIKGIEPGFRVLGAPAGLSKQQGMALVRIALSLGLPATATATAGAIIEALAHVQSFRSSRKRRLPAPRKTMDNLGAFSDDDTHSHPLPK